MVSMAGSENSTADTFGAQQGLVLPQERCAGLAEDAGEVVAGQVVHFDADRESPLELGHQVRRLRAVERTGGDEQDVVGLDRPVLGVDGRALDDRQAGRAVRPGERRRARGSSLRRLVILSISSMKMIPDSSASLTAAWLIFSGSIKASISC